LRFSIANICWVMFCVACLVLVFSATRRDRWSSSPIHTKLNVEFFRGIGEKTSPGIGFCASTSRSGAQLTGQFELLSPDSFDPNAYILAAKNKSLNVVREHGSASGNQEFTNGDDVVGFMINWQTNRKEGNIEIVYLGVRIPDYAPLPEQSSIHSFAISVDERVR